MNLIKGLPRGLVNLFLEVMDRANLVVISYNDAESSKIVDFIRQCKMETEMLLGTKEAYQIYMAVKGTSKLEGDIAEVGVYKGGSACLVCKIKGGKTLHLFDTFEDVAKAEAADNSFHKSERAASLEQTEQNLRKCCYDHNVPIYKGLFPDTAGPVEKKKFSFVHLDVGTYKSTFECLKFFYPRMTKGGIIISHDYFFASGVRKAFEEFFQSKPEPIIPLSESQCLVVKV